MVGNPETIARTKAKGGFPRKKKPGLEGPALKRRAAVRCHRGAAQTGVEWFASVEAVELDFRRQSPDGEELGNGRLGRCIWNAICKTLTVGFQ